MSNQVLQDWVCELPWKQQSVLLSALRGPDTHHAVQLKRITKWMRRIVQNNADVQHSYMRDEGLPAFEDVEKELEFTTVHFASHLFQGLEIVGYKHPDKEARRLAFELYQGIVVDILHLQIETKEAMEGRLYDRRE